MKIFQIISQEPLVSNAPKIVKSSTSFLECSEALAHQAKRAQKARFPYTYKDMSLEVRFPNGTLIERLTLVVTEL